jgi:hypothetical protein
MATESYNKESKSLIFFLSLAAENTITGREKKTNNVSTFTCALITTLLVGLIFPKICSCDSIYCISVVTRERERSQSHTNEQIKQQEVLAHTLNATATTGQTLVFTSPTFQIFFCISFIPDPQPLNVLSQTSIHTSQEYHLTQHATTQTCRLQQLRYDGIAFHCCYLQ